jgi:DNA gyrase/topoisomerase IV subunit B
MNLDRLLVVSFSISSNRIGEALPQSRNAYANDIRTEAVCTKLIELKEELVSQSNNTATTKQSTTHNQKLNSTTTLKALPLTQP